MCEQRERLIGYLYEEGDTAERAVVQAHLDECADCRAEIAGFRSVQNDLRAWDVPDHESVWRPFAPAPAQAWWQQVPGWALAAAAGLVLVSGATGGAVAYMMTPASQPQVVMQATPTDVSTQNTSYATAADLAAAEQRVLDRVRLQFAAFETQYSASPERVLTASAGIPGDETRLRLIEQMVADLGQKHDTLSTDLGQKHDTALELIGRVNNGMKNLRIAYDARYTGLDHRVERLAGLVDLISSK